MKPTIIFFGSFQHYSTYIAKSLFESDELSLAGVITTPPNSNTIDSMPDVFTFATQNHIPVLTPESLDAITPKQALSELGLDVPDLVVTAGYGKLLPSIWLSLPKVGALNLHFSLLPNYRGANPAEYAILRGEAESGITLIEMGIEFDTGNILSQASVAIEAQDTRETLYEKLYQLGAGCLESMITEYLVRQSSSFDPGIPQPAHSPTPEAKRLHRRDGYITWEATKKLMEGTTLEHSEFPTALHKAKCELDGASAIERASRALRGYPGLWTRIPTNKGKKIMKILSVTIENGRLSLLDVQVEGQQKARFNQIKNMILG